MKIEIEGRQVEAHVLSTCRKFIQEIADGKKTVETRAFSQRYGDMFLDPEAIEANERFNATGEGEWRSPMRQVYHLKLHDRHGHEVTVECDEIGIADMTSKGLERLRKEYGFKEFDEAAEQYRGRSWSVDIPCFYYFHISRVIDRKGV